VESLGRLRHPLALQKLFSLDALLGQVDVDRIPHRYPKASGPSQPSDQLLNRGFDQAIAHPTLQREQHEVHLVGRAAEAIAWPHVLEVVRGRERERLLGLDDLDLSDRFFGSAQQGPGLRMANFPSFPEHFQLEAGSGAVLLPDIKRERLVFDFQDLSLNLGEEAQQIFNQEGERRGDRRGFGGGLSTLGLAPGKPRRHEHGRRQRKNFPWCHHLAATIRTRADADTAGRDGSR
jgi:hypothetical protein